MPVPWLMRAINHALTGACIGLTVSEPAIALPAAVVSHFVLDAVPHFGSVRMRIGGETFRTILIVDTLLCACLVLALSIIKPRHWLRAAICAFLATSPDFMWVGKFLRSREGKPPRESHNLLQHFHKTIQWFERPIGALVELVWIVAMLVAVGVLL